MSSGPSSAASGMGASVIAPAALAVRTRTLASGGSTAASQAAQEESALPRGLTGHPLGSVPPGGWQQHSHAAGQGGTGTGGPQHLVVVGRHPATGGRVERAPCPRAVAGQYLMHRFGGQQICQGVLVALDQVDRASERGGQ